MLDQRITWSINAPDHFALFVQYGSSFRFVSACCVDGDLLTVFDVSRGDYRTLKLSRLTVITLVWAWSLQAPAPILSDVLGAT